MLQPVADEMKQVLKVLIEDDVREIKIKACLHQKGFVSLKSTGKPS